MASSILNHLIASHSLSSSPHALDTLPQTLTLLSLHAPFSPSSDLDDATRTSFIKTLDGLVMGKDLIGRQVGWSVAAVVVEQGREEVLEAWGRAWVVGLIPFVGKSLPTDIIPPLLSLLRALFLTSPSLPPFNREVAIPWLQRFTASLLDWAEKDLHLSLVLPLLPILIAFHPPTFRPHLPRLLPLSIRHLSTPTLTASSAHLYATLHLPTGKGSSPAAFLADLRAALGSATECMDQIAGKVWEEEGSLGREGGDGKEVGIKFKDWEGKEGDLKREKDGLKRIERSFGRLKGLIAVVCRMLRQPSPRPVPVPIGLVLALALRIFRLTSDGLTLDHANPQEVELARSLLPELYLLGCGIVGQLTLCVKQALLPHLTSIQSYLIYLLERTSPTPVLHLALLQTLSLLTTHIPPSPAPSSGSLISRATKVSLSNLTPLLPSTHQSGHTLSSTTASSHQSKGKGKKRSHADANGASSSLSLEAGSTPLTPIQAQITLASLQILGQLLPQPALSPSIRTLATRILLNMSLTLKTSKKGDRKLLMEIEKQVEEVLCASLARGGSVGEGEGTMGGEASWVVGGLQPGSINHRTIASLLHPLLPALIRPLPSASSLLFYKNEGKDERNARDDLALDNEASLLAADAAPPSTEDHQMDVEPTPAATAPPPASSKSLFDVQPTAPPLPPLPTSAPAPTSSIPATLPTSTLSAPPPPPSSAPTPAADEYSPFAPTASGSATATIVSAAATTSAGPKAVSAPLKDLWAEERKKQVEEDSDGEIPEIDMGDSGDEDSEEDEE